MMLQKQTLNAQRPTFNVQLRKRFAVAISLKSGPGWNSTTKREWAGSFAVCATQDDRSADLSVERWTLGVGRLLLSPKLDHLPAL